MVKVSVYLNRRVFVMPTIETNFEETKMASFSLFHMHVYSVLTLLLLNTSCPVLANSIDPDQLASEEAN